MTQSIPARQNQAFDQGEPVSRIDRVLSGLQLKGLPEFKEKILQMVSQKPGLSEDQLTQLLVATALENVDEANAPWSFAAARIYLDHLYRKAGKNRGYA
ncbi:MAG: ribonucleoside-diphosphate reductase subunit alpha, partial [Planifilum fimeticola]